MTGFIILTLRLLLGIFTLKFFIYLEPVATFLHQGYEKLIKSFNLNFFLVFGEAFFLLFVIAYIFLPIIFDALNNNFNENTFKVIGIKLLFLLIFCLIFNLLGLSAFIINTSWKWIGVIYGYMIVLYFGILGELKPKLFLEEPRYFLIDLTERTSLKIGFQFLAFFTFLLLVSWHFGTESAIAQAQDNLSSYLN